MDYKAYGNVFEVLEQLNINCDFIEHPPVYTIEDMDRLDIDDDDEVLKNLFIRDDKKKQYFLISVLKDKHVNLKALRKSLDCRPLSFASEESLMELLGLEKGAVTPLGVLNDHSCKVMVLFDRDILKLKRVGVHPNKNTATLWIAPKDLELVIRNHGNNLTYIDL